MNREKLIAQLQELGKHYRFDRFSDGQLLAMLQKMKNEANKKEQEVETPEEDIVPEDDIQLPATCEFCGATLTDAGECPVCDLGDEDVLRDKHENECFKEDLNAVENAALELEGDGFEEVYSPDRKFNVFRKVDPSLKTEYKAVCRKTGKVFDITYDQAVGDVAIDDNEISKLAKEVGKKLLPKNESAAKKYPFTILFGVGGIDDFDTKTGVAMAESPDEARKMVKAQFPDAAIIRIMRGRYMSSFDAITIDGINHDEEDSDDDEFELEENVNASIIKEEVEDSADRPLVDELNSFLEQNDVKETVYEGADEGVYECEIENGDWKHDHLRFNYFVNQFFNERGQRVFIEQEITDDDGSDVYSARHIIKIID